MPGDLQLKGGHSTTDPRLDRIPQVDWRSLNYPITAALPRSAAAMQPRSYSWSCPVTLDQGREGACVGFSISQEAAARPVAVPNITDAIARSVYKRAQMLDEWPGENYDGTSVLAGSKVGVERGWYREYRWALSINDLVLAVGYKGPAVLGIDWYDSMYTPDRNNTIAVSGSIVGGHAILCNRVDVTRKRFGLHNSWGSDYGANGDVWISWDDVQKLFDAGGEAMIPVVRAGAPSPRRIFDDDDR